MSAVNFLENKIETKVKFPVYQKPKLTENILLNYQLITFLSQDIVPTIEYLQENKVLPKNKFYTYLQKLSDDDSDHMFDIYKKNNRDAEYIKDYEVVTGYFRRLASQLLSEYQKSTDPLIIDTLYAIVVYEFILSSSPFVVIEQGNIPNGKLLSKIQKELDAIKLVFDKRFEALSNTKFTHGIYSKLFYKIKYCSHKQFLALVDGHLK